MSQNGSLQNSAVSLRLDDLTSYLAKSVTGISVGDVSRFKKYQTDPVGFGEEVLGYTFTDDVKRLMESVRDYEITIGISANATGKTHGAATIATWVYKSFQECEIYTAAAPPESNLKKLLWGEIGNIYNAHSDLFKDDEITSLHISRGPTEFITGVTIPSSGTPEQREGKFSGKHAPVIIFIIDEGDSVPDEVFKGIESCMSGGMARLLVLFNPRMSQGAVYRMIREGRANVVHLSAFSHPNVITGDEVIPGAVTRNITVRRIHQWCRPLAKGEDIDNECFELPDFLEGVVGHDQKKDQLPALMPGWYKIVDPAFSYMVLGQYPAQGSNQLISRDWVNKARTRWDLYIQEHGEKPPAGVKGIMGQDVGEFGDDDSASCFRYGGWVDRIVSWGGVDPLVTGDRASAEYKERDIATAYVDGTGVGSGVAPQMQRNGCTAVTVKVANTTTERTEMGTFYLVRDQLWWAVREWLRTDPGAMLPPDEELIEELLIATYQVEVGKIRVLQKKFMKKLLGRSPDKADALCLTFYTDGMFQAFDLS